MEFDLSEKVPVNHSFSQATARGSLFIHTSTICLEKLEGENNLDCFPNDTSTTCEFFTRIKIYHEKFKKLNELTDTGQRIKSNKTSIKQICYSLQVTPIHIQSFLLKLKLLNQLMLVATEECKMIQTSFENRADSVLNKKATAVRSFEGKTEDKFL